ncbi:MAG: hypothetical protein JWM20_770 [Patescibacteria group bacterium]|nr:hypothetical protein [Patescibacteria group bacterium]
MEKVATPIVFNRTPIQVTKFQTDEIVTRENFTSFLILSFAVSMGSPEVQKVFFLWSEQRAQFSYSLSIENFVNSGGIDILFPEEVSAIKDAFLAVKKHSEEFREFEMDDEISIEIEALHRRPMPEEVLKRTLDFFNLEQVTSFQEFMVLARNYYARKKETASE